MGSVVLINDSQENTDEDVHADDGKDNKVQCEPVASIVSWYPVSNKSIEVNMCGLGNVRSPNLPKDASRNL